MSLPTETELTSAITEATRAAVTELFNDNPGHHFYYCSLITTGEALPPSVTAWSREALANAVAKAGNPSAEQSLKWSYADSPFYPAGEQHFDEVRRLFAARPQPDPNDWSQWTSECDLRLAAMERAMSLLDSQGLFGTGTQRDSIVINVEVMPPDHTNVIRARRLNPPQALTAWLTEAAEP